MRVCVQFEIEVSVGCVCLKAYLILSWQSADEFVLRPFNCGTDRLKGTSDLCVTLSVFSS